MKATVMTIALLCAGAVYAQTSPPPAPSAAEVSRHMDDLATLLDLTDAQKAQVQTVLEQQHAKMKESFEQARASGTKPDWQQMKSLHEQLQQDTLQKLAPVLSATQMKKFQIIQQEMDHHMHHMGHGKAAPAGDPTASAPAQN